MIEEKENKNEELEVVLDENKNDEEVSITPNPLDKLSQDEPSDEKEIDKTYENEREIKLEEKKVKEIPEYSEDMPYSLKVRKRIQKEVAKRAEALAIRWLVDSARKRKDKHMSDKIFNELYDAYEKKGAAVKKREDVHKMAESNKAFAHFRW